MRSITPDDEDFIEMLNEELFKKDRIIYNYDMLIHSLNKELSAKSGMVRELQKESVRIKIEEDSMLRRRAFIKIFLKEKYNIDMEVEDFDEFITEKKFEEAKKRKK
jgi:hypothetical protein